MTPCQLFDWASRNVPNVQFSYCSIEDYKREQYESPFFMLQDGIIPFLKGSKIGKLQGTE